MRYVLLSESTGDGCEAGQPGYHGKGQGDYPERHKTGLLWKPVLRGTPGIFTASVTEKGVLLQMNILFFLKPKSEVAFIYDYSTLRQVLETMEFHKYASIPMLNKAGEYVGTMTEGDILWGIKKYTNLNLKEAETIFIQDFPRKADYEAVSADADMEDLLQKAMNQNFVPVVDDQKKFIGIITRKSIIEYCYEKIKKLDEPY